jgi:GT2 family glycosyltransferase
MSARVIAVVATHARPRELARLLSSLAGVESAVVCDNSASAEVHAVVESAPIPAHYLAPGENLGCGGGLRLAEEHAWKITGENFTHLLVLDDDAVLSPDTVASLVAALTRENAVAAYPLALAPDGCIGWTPGLRDPLLHRLDQPRCPPAEYRARIGVEVADFAWAQGICLLVRREAVEAVGFHRDDFWVRGEDLDFSLRLAQLGRTIFVPVVEVRHYPPENTGDTSSQAEYLKHAAMLQNIAYITLRLRHGWGQAWTVPGTIRRFVRVWGLRSVADALRALWRGVVLGEPAGRGRGETFLARFRHLRTP